MAVVDLTDQLGQRLTTRSGNLLHAIPKRLFEANAGLVPTNHYRALHYWRLHVKVLLAQKHFNVSSSLREARPSLISGMGGQ